MEKIIILIGKSGCGKGTQAQLLKEKFGFDHIASGDLLRARSKEKDFTGKKLSNLLVKGGLAPTAVMFKLWLEKMEDLKSNQKIKGIIMDGNPRKIKEAYLIDEVFEWYEWPEIKAILIDISDEESVTRLSKRRMCENKDCKKIIPFTEEYENIKECPKCGSNLVARNDDNLESVKKRLSWFREEVHPIIDYYEKTNRLSRVSGEGSIEEVFSKILKILD